MEKQHQNAMDRLKEALCSDNPDVGVLRLPDLILQFTILTGSSDYGVGAVLMPEDRPVGMHREKKAIAIMFWT